MFSTQAVCIVVGTWQHPAQNVLAHQMDEAHGLGAMVTVFGKTMHAT